MALGTGKYTVAEVACWINVGKATVTFFNTCPGPSFYTLFYSPSILNSQVKSIFHLKMI